MFYKNVFFPFLSSPTIERSKIVDQNVRGSSPKLTLFVLLKLTYKILITMKVYAWEHSFIQKKRKYGDVGIYARNTQHQTHKKIHKHSLRTPLDRWNFFTQDAKLFLIVYYYLTDYKYNNLKQYLLTKRNSHNS